MRIHFSYGKTDKKKNRLDIFHIDIKVDCHGNAFDTFSDNALNGSHIPRLMAFVAFLS